MGKLSTNKLTFEELAVTATTRPVLAWTLRSGANWACDEPKAADDDNLMPAAGAATMDADAIAAVAVILIQLLVKKD